MKFGDFGYDDEDLIMASMQTTCCPDVAGALAERFSGIATDEFRSQTRVTVPRELIGEVLAACKEEHGFAMLVDVTCVDYLNYRGATDRFVVVYLLADVERTRRLELRVPLGEECPSVPSAVALWEGANWLEREVWDMFGIRFEGHPDLRRILMPEPFADHPLRKDYPLQGRGERHNLPVLTREGA